MRSKVVAAQMASGSGVAVTICNGTRDGTLLAAARGERVGTSFRPGGGRAPSFKLWLRWAAPARGRVMVDAGAERVLRERGLVAAARSGSPGSRARFSAGDPVEVVGPDGIVGKGIAEHSSEVLDRLRASAAPRSPRSCPRAPRRPMHRDRFVLT